jgi:hypothetical protein
MKKLERLEQEVESLSPEEAAEFRAWFLQHDWAKWDRQFDRDAKTGKLDAVAEEALRDYDAGRTTRF